MSTRHSLPDSLELLLDTMCNTFGGVMFITLSLALMLFVCNRMLRDDAIEDVTEEDIRRIREETVQLESKAAEMSRRLEDEGDAEEVTDEQKRKYIENKRLEMELKQKRHQYEQLLRQNRADGLSLNRNEKRIAEVERRLNAESEKIEDRYKRAAGENGQLKARIAIQEELLKNTEEKSIHFARNIGTRLTPYWFFIKGSVVYRIDTQLKDRRELNVSIEGNTVLLTPKNGTPIGKELSLETTRRLLSGFPNSAYFCNVMVHPDSMEAFVQFRRNLRSLGYKVNWNARTRFALVFASNPEYSSSD